MAEVVEALEGSIAPIECISQASDGSIVCSRESEPGHVCPTKLLWTRVRGAIVRTLQDTTLADLVLGPALIAGDALSAGHVTATTPLPTLPTAERTATRAAAHAASTERPSSSKPLTTGA